MNKNRLLSSLIAVMAVLAADAQNPAAPKLVVGILIDQLRSDYLQAFMPLYGEGGFKRLMAQGRVYTQGEYPLTSVDRASAAATLSTGSTPFYHGIVGQQWFERATLRRIDCVEDADCKGVATDHGASPQFLAVSTIGDELKVASDGKSLVYAIAPFRDAAVLTAGHAADAAVWIDDETGNWCTSDYYGSLPDWANSRDLYHPLEKQLKRYTWEPFYERNGDYSYYLSDGTTEPFEHEFKGQGRYRAFKTSAPVNEEVATLAGDCLRTTGIGNDPFTDYLALTFYAAPEIPHPHGHFRHQACRRPAQHVPHGRLWPGQLRRGLLRPRNLPEQEAD